MRTHRGHRPPCDALSSRRTAARVAFGCSLKLLVARFRFCLPSSTQIDRLAKGAGDGPGWPVPGRLVSRYMSCVVVNCGGLYFLVEAAAGPPLSQGVGSLLISVAMAIAWLAVVKQQWVRAGADSYARALLEVCDSGPLCQ